MHLLFALPATKTIADVIGALKSNSSRWLSPKFEWQVGYGAFSVSASNRKRVIAYIENQEKHHKKRTFEDEFLAFLKASGVDYDPRFVFD